MQLAQTSGIQMSDILEMNVRLQKSWQRLKKLVRSHKSHQLSSFFLLLNSRIFEYESEADSKRRVQAREVEYIYISGNPNYGTCIKRHLQRWLHMWCVFCWHIWQQQTPKHVHGCCVKIAMANFGHWLSVLERLCVAALPPYQPCNSWNWAWNKAIVVVYARLSYVPDVPSGSRSRICVTWDRHIWRTEAN